MARLSGSILTEDAELKTQMTAPRGGAVPVTVTDERPSRGSVQDVVVVDGRFAEKAIGQVEHVRSLDATVGIFFVDGDSSPDAILTSMRAGANEFFAWPPSREAIDEGLKRTAARRVLAAQLPASTVAFFGSKGGAGTTTIAVNFAVDVVRVTKKRAVIVDIKPGLGEVALFLGVRSRYTLLDDSTTCTGWTGSSCGSWWSSTSRAWRSWPAPTRSIVPAWAIPPASKRNGC